ncbi:very-long-chain (3R)-3-hydroxyacyl-CoA dehydratase 2 [Scyliorhinus canicula]|uniref:very-long-chain (3R)-3-hydroxyacyl-CoA dehydratase 2 n=1 Tax=Scyliorhinus canicula TaxID=7830 RepID=UPI0018F512E5|nr:very-long-chain (3R)-3-hydroxyacyl-CoA dehydratase 2 [Scyliorhinus canicula]
MAAAASGSGSEQKRDGNLRKRRGPGPIATAYMVVYNVVMTAGWLVIAVGLIRAGLARGTYHGLYHSIEKPLKFFQTGALLEILHCAVGIVPSSVVLTGFQVMSRVFLTWAVTHSVKQVRGKLCVHPNPEIVKGKRNTRFSSNILLSIPSRYTLFIVLYPMGVTGELLTIYAALPHVRRTGLYSVTLPNKYNISFDYYTVLILVMISYIPLFPQLYFHMLRQRRKVLTTTEESKKIE